MLSLRIKLEGQKTKGREQRGRIQAEGPVVSPPPSLPPSFSTNQESFV